MFVDFFIHRPVFATVCALLIILAGAICIPNLPVAMYPNLAPPVVAVTATYVGADAETVEKAVTIPLEESINGVEGMRYISSSSTNSGTSAIDITFQTGYNLDIAAVDVQNRVASVEGRLPGEVISTGITVIEIQLQLRLWRRLLHARRPLLERIHLQLPRRLREGRAQARARRGRCDDLRRAQVRHARVARSGTSWRRAASRRPTW